jgi:DNA topoisomerase IB
MVDDDGGRDEAVNAPGAGADEDGPDEREVARAERESMYPMTGYALVRVEYQEPPGEALTKVRQYGRLEAVELPDSAPMVAYVVYDAEGNAYRRADVEAEQP